MSGGEHAWDLITKDDQAIATGLYIFTVKNNKTGFIKREIFDNKVTHRHAGP